MTRCGWIRRLLWSIADVCRGCGQCVDICEFQAPSLVETPPGRVFAAEINASLCKGCGTCASWCPSGAIVARHFTDRQVIAQIDAFFDEPLGGAPVTDSRLSLNRLIQGEDQGCGHRKTNSWDPRIVVFACNWCSYAGADTAGVSRIQHQPYFRHDPRHVLGSYPAGRSFCVHSKRVRTG